MSINYVHTTEIHNTAAAEEILPYVFSLIYPKTVVDFGCGNGSWLNVAKSLGASTILGVDGIEVDAAMRLIKYEEFLQHDFTTPLTIEQKYNLALCLEVVEHLPEYAAENIINMLTSSSDVILFSAAIPGQGGQAHLNEQWPIYWQHKFAERGFFPVDIVRQKFWENPKVDWWYKQNTFIYVNQDAELRYNFKRTAHLPVYIHPDLFALKMKILADSNQLISGMSNLIERDINNPNLVTAVKGVIKSIIK